eukprot:Polyplicarium_translucidae@DN1467_c0_g1_i1.p1
MPLAMWDSHTRMVDFDAPYDDVFYAMIGGWPFGASIGDSMEHEEMVDEEAVLDAYRLQLVFEEFDWDKGVKVHDSWRIVPNMEQDRNVECELRVWYLPRKTGKGGPARFFSVTVLRDINRCQPWGAWLLRHEDGRFLYLSAMREAIEGATKVWRFAEATWNEPPYGDERVLGGPHTPHNLAQRYREMVYGQEID